MSYSKNRRIGHLYKSSTFVRAPVQTFPTAFPIKCLFIRAPPRYNCHRPVFSFPKRQLFFIRWPHYYLSKSPIIHNDQPQIQSCVRKRVKLLLCLKYLGGKTCSTVVTLATHSREVSHNLVCSSVVLVSFIEDTSHD